NQTACFLASDVDPGVTGYVVAVGSDGGFGCPVAVNFLIGDEFVKYSTRHHANLRAGAVSALLDGVLPGWVGSSATAARGVYGVVGNGYNRAPRVLAVSSIGSRADGNDTLLIINRVGGSLATGAAQIGPIFGLLFDDAENARSFTFTANVCQFRSIISNSFPRTTPRFETLITAGRSGWLKFWSTSDFGLLVAVINNNDCQSGSSTTGAFSGGHNLHHLTLSAAASYIIPIFPPTC